MLIKNIETVDHLKQFKHSLFRFSRLINNCYDFTSISLIHLFLIHFLILFPFTSILFKRTDYFSTTAAQIFRTFLLSNLPNTLNINITILYAALTGMNLTILGAISAHFVFSSVFSTVTKMLSFSLKILSYLIVPIIDLAITGYLDMLHPSSGLSLSIFGAIAFFSSMVLLAAILLTLKFELRVMRKQNIFWNLDNDVQFYGLSYVVFKTFIISFTDVSASLCLLSLGVWFYHKQMKGGCIGKQSKAIQYSIFNYIAAGDAAVLLYIVLGDGRWALGLWAVLIACSVVNCILTLYRHKLDSLHLPSCDQGADQFYHFFYSYRESFRGEGGHVNVSSKSQSQKIAYLHKTSCRSKTCFLAGMDEFDMEELVSRVIEAKKNDSVSNRVLSELWSLQLGRKSAVEALVDKRIDVNQEFMIYSIEKMTKDSQVTIKNSESNKGMISKLFYDLIYEISSYYSQFYEELTRTHPKMDLIVEYGTTIAIKIQKLKCAYSDLLKSKLINFRMIQLYMQFLNNFIGQNALDKDDIGRLMKAQQNIYFEDISENYIPTISLYLETGSIENANSEAQKFLHSTRFELKYKNITDVTYPSLSIEKLKQVASTEATEANDDPIYSFFKQAETQYGISCIVFEERVVKQKKVMVMQMNRVKFSDQKNYFLVNSDFGLKLTMHKQVKVKNGGFRAVPLLLSWEELFRKYIVPNQQKIAASKMIKIPTVAKECIMVVKRLRCLIQDHIILQAQIFVTSDLMRKNRNSILAFRRSLQTKILSCEFQFQVGSNDENDKLVFYGLKGAYTTMTNYERFNTLSPQYKQYQNQLVSSILQQRHRHYDKDIKTYRLYDGELYNVDLEDREAYNNMFERHVTQIKRIEVPDNSSLECYLFVAVVVLGLALAAFSLTLIIKFQNASNAISTQYSQFLNIESLIIDFTRILSLLRDYSSGFLQKFPGFSLAAEIGVSFGRIQNLKNEIMFPNEEYTIQFKSVATSGTIIELIDVILAHVTEVLSNGDLSLIEEIHSTCMGQLNEMIKAAQGNVYGEVVAQISSVSLLSNTVLYSSLGVVSVLYFLMVFYCIQSNTQLKKSLSSLLFISDSEARMHQENADKMKYAVEMIRKNFEIDPQNLLIRESDFKRRKNPKEAIQSREIVYSIAVIAVMGLLLHLTCLFVFEAQFNSQLADFQTMKDQTISTTTVYHTSAELANYVQHAGAVDNQMLSVIRGNLTYLEYNIVNFLFSPDLTNFISLLYFENSSSVLTSRYNLSATQASNTTPGFTVANPFQIGLAIYLNRQNYYFFNNLTEDFAHTGVYSGPFAAVLTNLTQNYKSQSVSMIGKVVWLVNLFNGCIIAIDLGYILAFVFIYYYFRKQLGKIKQILVFFEERFRSKKTPPEEKEDIVVRSQEDSDDSSEEERSLLEVKQEAPRNTLAVRLSMKKKPSIETSNLHYEE